MFKLRRANGDRQMNRRNLLISTAAAATAAVLPFAPAALAQGAAVDDAKMAAMMGGDFATATSQLALQKGKHRAVQTFAELEIAEQAAVAEAFGSKPGAAGVSQKHAAILEKLQAADGAAFDATYIDGQIEGHEELLAIHKKYARTGDDPMARGASIVGVPAIQSHLAMLRGIKGMIG
jgi:putative membrane protein